MKRGSTLPSALSPTLPHTTAKNDENTRLGVLQRAIEAADLEAHIKRGALAQAAAHASEFTSCGSDGVVKLLPGAIEAITKAASGANRVRRPSAWSHRILLQPNLD